MAILATRMLFHRVRDLVLVMLQILNWMPKEMVEFHLIIEDLSSRLSEEQQMGLIEVIHKYATPLEEDNNSNNEITLHTR